MKAEWCSDITWIQSTAMGMATGWHLYDKILVPDGWKLCPICGKERPTDPKKMAEILYEAWKSKSDATWGAWKDYFDIETSFVKTCFTAEAQAAIEAVFEAMDKWALKNVQKPFDQRVEIKDYLHERFL